MLCTCSLLGYFKNVIVVGKVTTTFLTMMMMFGVGCPL
jgi:hypothetical protein